MSGSNRNPTSRFRTAVALSFTTLIWPIASGHAAENEQPEQLVSKPPETLSQHLENVQNLVEELRTCAPQVTCDIDPVIEAIDRAAAEAYGLVSGQISTDTDENSQPCFKKNFLRQVGTSETHINLARLVHYEAVADSLSEEARKFACTRSHSDFSHPETEVLIQKLCENTDATSLDEAIQLEAYELIEETPDFCPEQEDTRPLDQRWQLPKWKRYQWPFNLLKSSSRPLIS